MHVRMPRMPFLTFDTCHAIPQPSHRPTCMHVRMPRMPFLTFDTCHACRACHACHPSAIAPPHMHACMHLPGLCRKRAEAHRVGVCPDLKLPLEIIKAAFDHASEAQALLGRVIIVEVRRRACEVPRRQARRCQIELDACPRGLWKLRQCAAIGAQWVGLHVHKRDQVDGLIAEAKAAKHQGSQGEDEGEHQNPRREVDQPTPAAARTFESDVVR